MLSALWITYNFQLCDLSNGRSRWRYEVERPRSGLSEANFLFVKNNIFIFVNYYFRNFNRVKMFTNCKTKVTKKKKYKKFYF